VWNGFPRKRMSHCAGLGASVQVGGAKTVEVSGHLPAKTLVSRLGDFPDACRKARRVSAFYRYRSLPRVGGEKVGGKLPLCPSPFLTFVLLIAHRVQRFPRESAAPHAPMCAPAPVGVQSVHPLLSRSFLGMSPWASLSQVMETDHVVAEFRRPGPPDVHHTGTF
jgi:hypothetical protein